MKFTAHGEMHVCPDVTTEQDTWDEIQAIKECALL